MYTKKNKWLQSTIVNSSKVLIHRNITHRRNYLDYRNLNGKKTNFEKKRSDNLYRMKKKPKFAFCFHKGK